MTLHRKPTLPRHLFVALAITAACGAFAPEADACGGGWWPEVYIDYRVQGIASAEKQLEQGHYDMAAGSVIRMIPHIRAYKSTTGDPIINRALQVLAVATARKDGALDVAKQVPPELHGSWLGSKTPDRDANLEWSVATLKAVRKLEKKQNDPVVESQLGEAMARTEKYRAEGKKLLEKLASKDLLTSPEAYRTLAELRAGDGDPGGRLAALERCRKMAKDAKVCKAAAATGNS